MLVVTHVEILGFYYPYRVRLKEKKKKEKKPEQKNGIQYLHFNIETTIYLSTKKATKRDCEYNIIYIKFLCNF